MSSALATVMAMCPGNFGLSALNLANTSKLMQHVHLPVARTSEKVWLVSTLLGCKAHHFAVCHHSLFCWCLMQQLAVAGETALVLGSRIWFDRSSGSSSTPWS